MLQKKYGGVAALTSGVGSNLLRGINSSEVQMRKEKYGSNQPVPRVPKTVWSMVKECFEDLIL
jgi:hypothetical protein